jgi:hypothetical protein
MAPNESLRQVEAEIRASIERSLDALRAEVARRLQGASDEALGLLRPAALSLPETLVPSAALATLEADAATAARRALGSDLLAGAAAIDAARTQGEVLRALLDAARRLAGRAAVLLAGDDGARDWGDAGFERTATNGPGAIAIPWSSNARWSLFAEGRGLVSLGAADCAPLAEALDVALPADGALIPLVLRDRLAAALYVDRLRDQRALAIEPLQVLTYLAALALETLPFRGRLTTPTLEATNAAGGRGLPLWDGRAGDRAAPAAAPSSVAAPAPATEGPRASSAATIETPVPPRRTPEEVEELLFGEAPPRSAPPAIAPGAATPAPAAWEAEIPDLDSLPELVLEPLPEFDADEAPAPTPATSPSDTVRVPAAAAPAAPQSPPRAIDPTEEDTLLLQRARADARAAAPPPPQVTSPIPIPPRPFEGDETFPGFTRPVPRPAPGVPTPPAAPPTSSAGSAATGPIAPPPTATSAGSPRSTAEVSAPADVRGPGRAFATRPQRATAGSGAEASHDEARRLAKLLVSEIKLYNEEQIEAGRRSSDIYNRLKEDIERSRQMYEERIDPRVRAQNDYFQQELVRILAGGDARALGA